MLLFQNDAELLFPPRLIPSLRNLRGAEFQNLIDQIITQPETAVEVLGFSLMMIRLASCLSCNADSYRSMNGCTACAHKTIRNFKGTDAELIQRWKKACHDVHLWLDHETPAEV